MKLELTRQEQNDLYTIAEGTRDGALEGTISDVVTGREDVQRVRDACARALESGAAEVHGLYTVEGVYDRATEMLFDPDSEFDFL